MPDAIPADRFVLIAILRQKRVRNPERVADEQLAALQDAGLLIVPKPQSPPPHLSPEW